MQSVRGLSIVLGSSLDVLSAVGAVVTFPELVAEVLKVVGMMAQEELMGSTKED